jgi:hypothetical protein
MSKLSKSPERDTFQTQCNLEKVDRGEKSMDELTDLFDVLALIKQDRKNYEESEEFKKNNLEYDLRTNDYIVEKCKKEYYAQNLYAALCNNEFVKNDVWPLLTDNRWSCSWRSAGGIVADLRKEGDYIDWYCSGIRDVGYQDDLDSVTSEQYVSEGVVTEEIKNDLFKLGWLIVDNNS